MKKWMALFLALLMLTGLNAAMAEQDDMVFSDDASDFVLLSEAVPTQSWKSGIIPPITLSAAASTAMKNPSRF